MFRKKVKVKCQREKLSLCQREKGTKIWFELLGVATGWSRNFSRLISLCPFALSGGTFPHGGRGQSARGGGAGGSR